MADDLRRDALAKANDLRRKLKQLDRLTGKAAGDERARDADRKRASRAARRVVQIPEIEDPARRARLERDIFEWLPFYHPEIYEHPFTDQIREIILAILAAFRGGGDQAIAASRGEGKTTSGEMVAEFCVLKGEVDFAVLFEAAGQDAEQSLQAIRDRLAENDRLAADYPEVCVPIRALNHTNQLARTMLVSGRRQDNGEPFDAVPCSFRWSGSEIVFPNVPGSRSAGAIIATRGLDAAVRGMKRGAKARRPRAAIINDPDTVNTVHNPDQGKKLEQKIERSIAGLGGQKKRVARVILTTVQRRGTVSDRFTDPKVKPSFRGRRFRFLVQRPAREDLWEEYVRLKVLDWENEREGKATDLAGELYAKQFEAMNAGAVVANPYRRGDETERSALQYYFNEVARMGPEAVATELDNDPPEESGPIESGITPHRIMRQVSGWQRQIVPPGATVLTQGIDVRKVALHWVVRAWRLDLPAVWTIDYGVHEVLGTKYGSDEGLELAIRRAILARLEATRQADYMTPDGQVLPVDLTLIDAGWQTDAVYGACAEAGLGVMPVMGFGRSSGCTEANFSEVQRRSRDRKPGDGWFLSRRGGIWLVCADADRWKSWEHARWLTAPTLPGCAYLFGEPGEPGGRLSQDEKDHHTYAHHLCNEVEIEEPYKGTMRRRWKAKSDNTHYLDATYYADVAGNMKGFRLGHSVARATKIAGDEQLQSGGWFESQEKGKRR
jgi:hypothetical protein